jgi:hypothetical protein
MTGCDGETEKDHGNDPNNKESVMIISASALRYV